MTGHRLIRRLVRSGAALAGAGALVVAGNVGRGAAAVSGPKPMSAAPTPAVVDPVIDPVIDATGIGRIEQRPGWSQRLFDLHAGSGGIAAAALSTRSRQPSDLDADLRLSLEECSQPWAVAPDGETYVCGGEQTVRIAMRPAIGDNIALDGLHLAAGGVARLRALLTVGPDAAPGQTATLDYTFTSSSN